MRKQLLASALALAGAFAFAHADAAQLVLLNGDAGTGLGLDDPTPATPVGLNPGTTVGQQRQIVYRFAMDLWGSVLKSDVPIKVGASFQRLNCTATGATLGSAGANWVDRDYPNAPIKGIWYNAALADSLAGVDLDPVPDDPADIVSRFNGDLGKPDCLVGTTWYYGLDGKTPPGGINFLNVVMHEIGHGLGFQGFLDKSTGQFLDFDGEGPRSDAYTQNAYDNALGIGFNSPTSTPAQRAETMRTAGRLVWSGTRVKNEAALVLDNRQYFTVTAPAGIAGRYLYGTASFGPPVSPANFTGQVVQGLDESNASGLSTTDACTPLTNAAAVAGKLVLVDRGTCGFVIKAANVQAAGGIGMVVADNVAGSPPPDLGGSDPNITIPAIRITLADGNTFKANLPVNVTFQVDPVLLQGADDTGRVRLYAPSVVAPGSTFSHYDTALAPNALMEPFDTPTVQAQYNVDLTPALYRDMGWKVNNGDARIGKCNTTVDVLEPGGFIVGANVQAWNNLCKSSAKNPGRYVQCMVDLQHRLRDAKLIHPLQGAAILVCTATNLKP
ncbi:serine protease [Lysobacter sp. LF1]|uniref:Serine protease n=1 Tax=Lysobacter stagni TaxID=3045172 RepID=A0ABT6XDR2_9GAMM|nr:PA domain-containing protein [Lysobacter sp. LF1]MDI9238289.1 serine protease [Lysobacter sp. LF1]